MANHLEMAMLQALVSLFERGWSQREIARKLGVDRETVARYVRQLRAGEAKPAIVHTGSLEKRQKPGGGKGDAALFRDKPEELSEKSCVPFISFVPFISLERFSFVKQGTRILILLNPGDFGRSLEGVNIPGTGIGCFRAGISPPRRRGQCQNQERKYAKKGTPGHGVFLPKKMMTQINHRTIGKETRSVLPRNARQVWIAATMALPMVAKKQPGM